MYFLYRNPFIKPNYQKKNIAMVVKAVIPDRTAKTVQNNASVLPAVLLPFFLIHKISVLKKRCTITGRLLLILSTIFLKVFFLSGLHLK
ncbi:hypothetical protein ATE49_15585 [Elizabethkingia miricola]|nr:hypothetical protein ATE49_15585 [Elizabethkingia miricola]